MTQTIDFRFELLFLLCVLITLISLIAAVVLMFAGRRRAGGRVLLVLGIGWAGYLSIVFLTAAVTPRLVIPRNHDLCFDEMCFAVVNVETAGQLGTTRASGIFYIVTVRASSHARGRAQSEHGLRALLWSAEHEYKVSQAGQGAWETAHHASAPLTARLGPGESILSEQVFDVSPQATDLGLVLTNGITPGYLVIGECPLFHKPTMLRLSQ